MDGPERRSGGRRTAGEVQSDRELGNQAEEGTVGWGQGKLVGVPQPVATAAGRPITEREQGCAQQSGLLPEVVRS
jgi:hypothetical protein